VNRLSDLFASQRPIVMCVCHANISGMVSFCALTRCSERYESGGEHKGGQMTSVVKLTDKQTALVDTLVARGCTIKDAAEIAGYAKGDAGRVTAQKTLKLPHVQAYMMQAIGEQLGVSATLAAARLVSLSGGAKSEYVQLEASKDILDRAGFKAPDKHMHLHAGEIKVSIDLG